MFCNLMCVVLCCGWFPFFILIDRIGIVTSDDTIVYSFHGWTQNHIFIVQFVEIS